MLPHVQRAKRGRVDNHRRYLVRQIGYLTEEWGTDKDVWVTVDKLLRAEEKRVWMRLL